MTRPYLLLSGLVFLLVGGLHGLRLVNGWTFQVGPLSLPIWVSVLGTLGPWFLCGWAWWLASARSGA